VGSLWYWSCWLLVVGCWLLVTFFLHSKSPRPMEEIPQHFGQGEFLQRIDVPRLQPRSGDQITYVRNPLFPTFSRGLRMGMGMGSGSPRSVCLRGHRYLGNE
ncbi:hypothetical protein GGR53DRAFT_475132, partial [Hypoxylon sp. FL1150]